MILTGPSQQLTMLRQVCGIDFGSFWLVGNQSEFHGRTLAMLVLMSIHDLMKLDKLRPTCSVKDFNGYKKGEQILGHHETKCRSKIYTTLQVKLGRELGERYDLQTRKVKKKM